MRGLKNGFTLIELTIVIGIIMLLVSLGGLRYGFISKKSKDAKRKADIEQIRSAIELYRSNNNTYPSTVINCSSSGGITDASGNIYLNTILKDPRCTTYSYYYTSSSTDYTLGAYLEAGGSSCGVVPVPSCGTVSCNYCIGPYGAK